MSVVALLVAALGLTTGLVTAEAEIVSGRCADGRVWTTSLAAQGRMLGVLNEVRAGEARPPFLRHHVLDRMAFTHSVDMACRDYFDHRTPEHRGVREKLKRVADGQMPDWTRLAEVIGTSETPQRQVDRWLDSRPHRRALLEEQHESVGIGLVRIASGSRFTTYWTVELMTERRDGRSTSKR